MYIPSSTGIARRSLLSGAASFGLLALSGCASSSPAPGPQAEIGFIEIDRGIKLRRMVVRNPHAKGVVLFLHGFPETLHAWKDIALQLGRDYEVHAFDWPGYGLSSRPPVEQFAYAPSDYAGVLRQYIRASGIDTSKLVIYATDIGALPALLAALNAPDIARTIVVGDFAPFDRPQYMYPSLQSLKSKPSSEATLAYMNKTWQEILENAYRRGLPEAAQFEISQELKDDMYQGWNREGMTSAGAFHHYYASFTRDQNFLESHLAELRTPIRIVWGEKDLYIDIRMGRELAERTHADLNVLSGLGHYPHLQKPEQTVREVRSLFADQARVRADVPR